MIDDTIWKGCGWIMLVGWSGCSGWIDAVVASNGG